MQFRILHSVLATSLVALMALPAVAEDAGTPPETHPGSVQLRSATFDDVEPDGQLRLLALVGPFVAISVLSILGLTITFGGLRREIWQRRVV